MAITVIQSADVKVWEKLAEPTPTLWKQRFGISLWSRWFRNPHTGEAEEFSQFEGKTGHQVLGVTKDGLLILTRQYKQGVHQIGWEVAGGVAEAGETPEQTAARELREETGYRPTTVILLGTRYIHTRKSPDQVHLFLALGCELVASQELDPNEVVEVVTMSLNDYWDLEDRGEVFDITTTALINLAQRRGYFPPPPTFTTE